MEIARVLIVGAGGHGKVVLDILRAARHYEPAGFIDADVALTGKRVGGLPVFGPANVLGRIRAQQNVAHAIIAIGDNRTRHRYATLVEREGFELVNAIHPTAFVSPHASLGKNVMIAPHACVITEARVGDSTIVNTGAIVEHECEIGDAAHVAPGTVLAGRARVGAFAFLGIGSRVLPCLSVGEHATVGAGAVVLEDVPPFTTVVGVPARMIKHAPPEPAATIPPT